MWTIIFFTCWQCSSFVMGNDDWLSHLSDESQPKCEKSPPKSSKNKKLIFILHSTSDDWPSDPSNKSQLKCKKGPLSHQKMKCLVLDYIQLLMISWVTKFNWNVRKGLLSHHKMKCSFLDYVQLLMIGWGTYNFQYVSWLFVSRTSSPYYTVMTIRQKFQERSSSTFYQSIPPPSASEPLSDSTPEQETGEFQFKMDMDIWTWTPSANPLQPKTLKCSFLHYIQHLMISRAIWATKFDWNVKKAP